MIADGRISVNGQTVTSPALNVHGHDRILVDEMPLPKAGPRRLWRYHKPAGVVTTMRDERGRETVFDKLPANMPRVMPVGRLDMSSEGLLLLTNAGDLKRWLEHPSTGWLRRYRVRVLGRPEERTLNRLRRGVTIGTEQLGRMEVTLDRQLGANAWLTVGLRQGRYREVRRAMESVGLRVNRLIRLSFGPFALGSLRLGEVEEIQRRVLRDQIGNLENLSVTGATSGRPERAALSIPPDSTQRRKIKTGRTNGRPTDA